MIGLWDNLALVLTTDPRDVGCEEAWRLIDAYAEIVESGGDPETTFPGITVHLRRCDPCGEDYRGLLEAMSEAAQRSRSGRT